jgi:MFS superfamily sulfate permease-like transporter
MSSFASYLIGFLILIVGLAFAAYLLNIPTTWIVVGVIVLLGIGVLSATSRTKMRDPTPGAGGTNTTVVEMRPPSGPTA